MKFIENIKKQAQEEVVKIVLPETMDERILKAAEITLKENIANLILIGNKEEILAKNKNLSNCEIIDPETSELTHFFAKELFELRKNKGITEEEALNLLKTDYMYFACMMVKEHLADGVVSGACHSTANTLRPALQIIKTMPNVSLVSTFFMMEIPNCSYKEDGLYLFSDCGLVQNPTKEELADIALSSIKSFEDLTNEKAITAMLSHSTLNSAQHEMVTKVREATKLAKEKNKEALIDGELQLDAAIDEEIAKLKAPNSAVAGKANVLIFPNLDAGNIGYKLVQRFAHANAYGPITQGMNAPINDLSRGCTIEDIIGTIAITAVQAQNKKHK